MYLVHNMPHTKPIQSSNNSGKLADRERDSASCVPNVMGALHGEVRLHLYMRHSCMLTIFIPTKILIYKKDITYTCNVEGLLLITVKLILITSFFVEIG